MDNVTKDLKPGILTVRESKAAALDARVKQEIASEHAAMLSDMARLKALRLARDAAAPLVMTAKPRAAKTSNRAARSVSATARQSGERSR